MKLSTESQEIFDNIKKSYQITDEAGLLLLRTVCESLDLVRSAEKEIEKHGLVISDKYKGAKQNPACQVLSSARATMLQSLKQLNLDFEDFEQPKKVHLR
jgi:phage terminase small subunit